MSTFLQYHTNKHLSTANVENVEEFDEMVTGDVGLGSNGTEGGMGNEDSYATGDARLPVSLAGKKVAKRKLKKKRTRNKS
tara:strand:+ start:319 stop:558 length:240 start_codon:yes stop_codon:yes gene_type:complete